MATILAALQGESCFSSPMRSSPIVETVLGTVVLLAFSWSVVLYMQRVIGHRGRKRSAEGESNRRRQETGAAYAFVGLVLYGVGFANLLPGSPTGLRDFLKVLPGVGQSAMGFSGSVAILGAITAAYVARVLVYYRLVPIRATQNWTQESLEGTLNARVAPNFALLTLVLCLVASVAGLWSLPWWAGLLLLAALLVLAWARVFEWAYAILRRCFDEIVKALLRGLRVLGSLPSYIVVAVALIELHRPSGPNRPPGALRNWIERYHSDREASRLDNRLAELRDRLVERDAESGSMDLGPLLHASRAEGPDVGEDQSI